MIPKLWLNKHYPIPANELKEASDEDCTNHYLNKWEGAKEENLLKGMKYSGHFISNKDGGSLMFGIATCALCVKYPVECKNKNDKFCPIVRLQGCSCYRMNIDYRNIYKEAKDDPTPMINLLKQTLIFVRNEE